MYNEPLTQVTRIHIPGPEMSKLLGLSLIEYYNLKHDELIDVRDAEGNITDLYMRVDPNNDVELLNKIKHIHNLKVSLMSESALQYVH